MSPNSPYETYTILRVGQRKLFSPFLELSVTFINQEANILDVLVGRRQNRTRKCSTHHLEGDYEVKG